MQLLHHLDFARGGMECDLIELDLSNASAAIKIYCMGRIFVLVTEFFLTESLTLNSETILT